MESIPWYRSPVFVGLIVAFLSKGIEVLGLADKVAPDQVANIVNWILDGVTLASLAFAGFKRYKSSIQPLAVTKAGAEEKTLTMKSHPLIGAFLLLTTFLMLTGCPATLAVKEAQTTEQRAGALIGDFTIFQRAALEIGNDETVPVEVRQRIVAAPIALRPAVDQGIELLRSYRMVSGQLAAGTTTEDKVRIAAANLTAWIVDLTPKIAALRQTIEESRK